MMNFFIFGSAGFIGTHLYNRIISEVSVANVYRYDISASVNSEFIFNDVKKPIQHKGEIQGLSVIYNLAAVHITPGYPDCNYFETNVLGAENVCDFARDNNINTIVFTSSVAPYGPTEDLKEETAIPMPVTPYGISKLSAEYIHKEWQLEDAANRRLVIVRPGVVFGQWERGNFTRLYHLLKKGIFFYPGRKDTIKAAVYVKDVVNILYNMSLTATPGVALYNLTYEPAPTIQFICKTMAEVTGLAVPKLVVHSGLLKIIAGGIYYTSRIFGKKISGIHPERVKKLMVSTNISGKKLNESNYRLNYSLKEAIADWFIDCDKAGLF